MPGAFFVRLPLRASLSLSLSLSAFELSAATLHPAGLCSVDRLAGAEIVNHRRPRGPASSAAVRLRLGSDGLLAGTSERRDGRRKSRQVTRWIRFIAEGHGAR